MKITFYSLLIACSLFLFACGGKPINWEARVGTYTYEDAKRDYGEARGAQKLKGDRIMYLWFDKGGKTWNDTLALIFGPDGTLEKVEKNDR